MVLQKEPHAKCMVAKVEELFLRVDNNGEEGGLVVDVGLDKNIAPYKEEGGEEVLAIEVECGCIILLMHQVYYDFEVEGDDQE